MHVIITFSDQCPVGKYKAVSLQLVLSDTICINVIVKT